MPSSRDSLIKLGGVGAAAFVAVAAQHFGAGEVAPLIGAGTALLESFAHATFGHVGLDVVHDLAKRFGDANSARGRENRDLHRLIGETVANALERSADHGHHGKFGSGYL